MRCEAGNRAVIRPLEGPRAGPGRASNQLLKLNTVSSLPICCSGRRVWPWSHPIGVIRNAIIMKRHTWLTVFIGLLCAVANAGDYKSDHNRFTIKYDSDWKTTRSPDLTIEIALVPNSDASSPTAFLSVGATYDQTLVAVTTEDFLKVASSAAITRHIKSMPIVTNFKVLREGKAKLGDVNAYEVLMSYTTPAGLRYRHTFMTFYRGYMYNASFHSTPESFKSDFEIAKKVFTTFRISR